MTAALSFLPAAAPLFLGEKQAKVHTLNSLRQRIDQVVAEGRNQGPPLPTGIQPLDHALGGGLPRGRITEITGALGTGKTALLRQVVARVLAADQWVAWIDARRTLAPQPWANLGKRFVVIRPREWKRAAWSADILLRSGVFALVVLDGAPIVARNVGFRLAQIARERDAAIVVMSDVDKTTRINGTLRLRVAQGAAGLTISSLKSGHSFEVPCAVPSSMARSLCAHPEIPDRRGVARGSRRPWAPKTGTNVHEQEQHAVSWGGLGAAAVDHAHGRPEAESADSGIQAGNEPRHNATPQRQYAASINSSATGPAIRPDGRHVDNLTPHEIERLQRHTDHVARNWSRFTRGRRRAAESTWGRQTRRERARERTGAHLESHLGQGWGKLVGKGRVEPRPRSSLGRVAEGVG